MKATRVNKGELDEIKKVVLHLPTETHHGAHSPQSVWDGQCDTLSPEGSTVTRWYSRHQPGNNREEITLIDVYEAFYVPTPLPTLVSCFCKTDCFL